MTFEPVHITQRKEQISVAFINALAAAKGLKTYDYAIDDESVDIGLTAKGHVGDYRNPRIEIQLKCTETPSFHSDGLHFVLKRKNYEDLSATDLHVPKILVVLTVASNPEDWLHYDIKSEAFLMYCKAYWLSLKGKEALPEEQQSKTVVIPTTQEFNLDSLLQVVSDSGTGRRLNTEVQNV